MALAGVLLLGVYIYFGLTAVPHQFHAYKKLYIAEESCKPLEISKGAVKNIGEKYELEQVGGDLNHPRLKGACTSFPYFIVRRIGDRAKFPEPNLIFRGYIHLKPLENSCEISFFYHVFTPATVIGKNDIVHFESSGEEEIANEIFGKHVTLKEKQMLFNEPDELVKWCQSNIDVRN